MNTTNENLTTLDSPIHPVALVDTTIREGQQHGHVRFSQTQALKIATLLDSFGIDIVEVGHPAISEQDANTAKAICHAGLSAETLAHARATPSDAAMAANVGASWVGIFSGINELSVRHKLHLPRKEILECIRSAIVKAKDHDLRVRFTCEDASRTAPELVTELFHAAIEAGADRVSYADTVGIMTPTAMRAVIASLVQNFGPVVHVHCHNDYGMATANALAAYEAGAVALDVSVDGIGERCGIAPIAEVACALRELYQMRVPWNLPVLTDLSSLLRVLLRDTPADTRPAVGKFAFTHKAGIHVAAEIEDETAYEPFPPAVLNQTRRFILSRLTGSRGTSAALQLAGIHPGKDLVSQIVKFLKKSDQCWEMVPDTPRRGHSKGATLPDGKRAE